MFNLGSSDKSLQNKKIAVLIDPDKTENLLLTIDEGNNAGIDFFLVGGSLVSSGTSEIILEIKRNSTIPVLLFPGNSIQLSKFADGILLLSLISGRNPEFLIGQHVHAAFYIKQSNLLAIPTSYILIDGGKTTSVEYVSNTKPIPADKPELVAATALAGEQLGHKLCYLEAGSGALHSVAEKTIEAVCNTISNPIWVGGGIRTEEQAAGICKAGASGIVIGSVAENNRGKILEISRAVRGLYS